MREKIEVFVYGAKIRCASCVNAPSSIETASWLEAALSRKYDPNHFIVRYVDIFDPKTEEEQAFSQRVIKEDLWYPVIVINDEIIAEGTPQIKAIYKALDELGVPSNIEVN